MCGVAGVLRWDGQNESIAVQDMVSALSHRGPDAEECNHLGPITLGHRRLSIIDLNAAANQPMHDAEGRGAIVYNGEIYNYRELRDELRGVGEMFSTDSDTEVLLKGLARYGESFLPRVIGMFALAFWDIRKNKLLLARDRLGKKPLYYFETSLGVVFASELTSLRRYQDVPNDINPNAIVGFLSVGYTPTSECIINDVKKLPPGHVAIVEKGKPVQIKTWWDLPQLVRDRKIWNSFDEAVEYLDELIDKSVKCRMISDVPLGAFLSGGIDSAVVVNAMRRGAGTSTLNTYTMSFADKSFDEGPAAHETAESQGVDNYQRTVALDFATTLPEIIRFCDEPFADTSIIPFYHLSSFASEKVKVALSGDGGDELFAGYETYVADKLHRTARMFPSCFLNAAGSLSNSFLKPSFQKVGLDYKVRQFLSGCHLPANEAHYHWRNIFNDEQIIQMLNQRQMAGNGAGTFQMTEPHMKMIGGDDWLTRYQYFDIKTWLVDDILVKVDRMSMAHSLEVRTPFLDHRLVEFALSIPENWRLKGLKKKHIFKCAARRRLDAKIINRPKSGFGAPVSSWLLGPLRDLARAATSSAQIANWIEPSAVENLWREHETRKQDHGYRLFTLTCLGLWLEQHT
ncbi:asparagine synthase (glutamine-hydrolyzing) [Rhodospirillales bacterium]|nr:asparagine synthase (glutamine-hydrolyzing) [Rhodospirillales bacterium]